MENKKTKKPDLENWLLSLTRPIKKSVVVTLLIKPKGDIRFLTMSDFDWWRDKDESDDEDEVSKEDVEKLRKTTPAQHFSRDYIL